MKRVNIKLLASLVVGTLVLTVGVHFLHGFQVDRNAKTLLSQAQRERSEGNDDASAKLYRQYLKHRDDPQAYSEYAVVITDIASRPNAIQKERVLAYSALEEAVRVHPELDDVRRLLVDYLIKNRLFSGAVQHLDTLRAAEKDPKLDMQYALCKVALGREQEAEKLLYQIVGFKEATQDFEGKATGATNVEAYVLLADLLRLKLENPERADQVMTQMITANKESAKAYLEHGRYLQRTEKDEDKLASAKRAEADYSKALELAPEDPNIILAVAEVAATQKEYDRAKTLLDDGVKKAPENEGMYRALATLWLAQNKPDEAIEELNRGLAVLPQSQPLIFLLTDIQFQKNDLAGVRKSIDSIRKTVATELADYLDARVMFAEKKWTEAAATFERLRPLMVRVPELVVQIDFLLGQCYENTSQSDRAREAYKSVSEADPRNIQAVLGYARALQANGKSEDAARVYESVDKVLVDRKIKGPGVAGNLLQNELNKQLKLPAGDRDWTRVDQLVDRLGTDASMTDVQKAVMQTDILLIKGAPEDLSKAAALLVKARAAHPKELSVWVATVKLMQKEDRKEKKDNHKRSLAALDLAAKQLGDVAALRTLRADLISRKASGKDATPEEVKEAGEQLAKLETGIDVYPEDQQLGLLADLGGAYYRLRDYESVRRCWQQVAEKKADDPKIRQTLFDLSLEFGDDAGMTSVIEEIKTKFGVKDALYNYCQASKIIADVRGGRQQKTALAEARTYLKDAAKVRGDWHELPRLEGEVDELDGRDDAAIVNYQRSMELGPINPVTGNRLLNLLIRKGRMVDAKEVIRQIGSSANPKFREIIGMYTNNAAESIESAEDGAKADPKNAEKLLWLAQLYSTAKRFDEAEDTFRKVIDIAPQMPQGYLLLVNQLANLKKRPEAEAVIRQAEKELPAETAGAVLGQCYEIVGDQVRAEKYYQDILDASPDDAGALRGIATYYLRTNRPENATKFVQQVLDQKQDPKDPNVENVTWARRAMAQILSGKGDYPNLQKAVKLLQDNAVAGQLSPEDTLMLASLLAQRPELVSRNKAIELLETLDKTRPLKLEEQLVLVQLYDRVDRWDDARERMGSLLTKSENNPTYLATFAQLLLKHGDVENAERWVSRLATLQPDSLVTVQLQASVLVKRDQADKAAALLTRLVKRHTPDQLPKLVTVTGVLEELGQYTAAEKLLREFAADEPRATLALAAFLARRGSTEEALALCSKARKSQPLPTVIQVGLGTLRQRPQEVTKAQHDLIQDWINKALVEDPDSSNLQLQVADFRDLEGNYDEVIKIYRGLLARTDLTDQRKAIVQNNLAFVLATIDGPQRNPDEALQLTDSSINVLGPSGDLLDTRAMAYAAKGNTKNALADLTVAVADSPSATKFLHLALVEQQAGNKAAAMKAFKDAQDAKLDPSQLSKFERKSYEQLVKQLKTK